MDDAASAWGSGILVLQKENIVPEAADKKIFLIAPLIIFTAVL
jgi:NADH:ubiquinone oxidoreductase subunit H